MLLSPELSAIVLRRLSIFFNEQIDRLLVGLALVAILDFSQIVCPVLVKAYADSVFLGSGVV